MDPGVISRTLRLICRMARQTIGLTAVEVLSDETVFVGDILGLVKRGHNLFKLLAGYSGKRTHHM